jgi:hypothetical protein
VTDLDPAVVAEGIAIEGVSWTAIRNAVRAFVERIDSFLDESAVVAIEEGPKLERHDEMIVWASGKTAAHELRYGDFTLWLDGAPFYVVHPDGVRDIAKLILAELSNNARRA